MTLIRVAVQGAAGRMGERICALVRADARFEIAAELTRDQPRLRCDPSVPPCHVLIDFSSPEGTLEAADLAVAHGAALLVGTTGLSGGIRRRLDEAARVVPVLIAPNTALGVAILKHMVAVASRLLGAEFAAEIIETHHVRKRDAPSGTALDLAATIQAATGMRIGPDRIRSRREGDVIGDHLVRFSGPGERVEIRHAAMTRDLFAIGALRAAAWLHGRPAGSYAIEDVLELTAERVSPHPASPDVASGGPV